MHIDNKLRLATSCAAVCRPEQAPSMSWATQLDVTCGEPERFVVTFYQADEFVDSTSQLRVHVQLERDFGTTIKKSVKFDSTWHMLNSNLDFQKKFGWVLAVVNGR